MKYRDIESASDTLGFAYQDLRYLTTAVKQLADLVQRAKTDLDYILDMDPEGDDDAGQFLSDCSDTIDMAMGDATMLEDEIGSFVHQLNDAIRLVHEA